MFAGTHEARAKNNFAQLRSTHVQALAPHRIQFCFRVFSPSLLLSFSPSLLSGLQKHIFGHDFSPQNNGAHVKGIPRLDVSDPTGKRRPFFVTQISDV